jgi:RND family efflux transporter MFP subunit
VALSFLLASSAIAQPPDALTIATGADHAGRQRMTGKVIDFMGDTLTWQNAAGSETSIAADRVIEIEAAWNDPHRVANQLFDSGQYAAALTQYGKAIGSEPRLWVRRLILAKAIWCCRNTGQQQRAVRTFLALVSSDPNTPYLNCIPLAWTSTPADAAMIATAGQAISPDAPAAAQLLGASWLLNSAEAVKGTEVLRRLSTHEDRRIALLAETQLWRVRRAGAEANNADRLGTIVQNMPLEFQAGPVMLWGESLATAGRQREAALAYLRVPVLHPLAGDLAAEAWYRAGQALAAERRGEEAALAWQTLLKEHPGSLLAESARQRLIELGMTASQIEQLEQSDEADSRLHLLAPASGTVIEKHAVEGEYVKEGEAIYRLADLSTVWLMLELFPEDAALVHVGGQVQAEVQSLPGQSFVGRVEFIDPQVNPQTRTVGVRVVIDNEYDTLKIGDYAKAKIEVALGGQQSSDDTGMLVSSQATEPTALAIPRSALLSAGENSVVYVETEPGRFEIRQVTLGSRSGEQVVVLAGLQPGEQVATRGNFLIDSQMQLAGNPSLIDPTKAQPMLEEATSPSMLAALEQLSEQDQQLAQQQRICPVTELPLGSMGTPKKMSVEGDSIFICCEGCRESVQEEPEKYLAKLSSRNPLRQQSNDTREIGLPPIGAIEPIEPLSNLPPIEAPQMIIEEDSSAQENDR